MVVYAKSIGVYSVQLSKVLSVFQTEGRRKTDIEYENTRRNRVIPGDEPDGP